MTERTIKLHDYTLGEEIAASVIHGVGAALSIAALTLMVVVAAAHGGGARMAGALVFGFSLIAEYTASTLYHALPQPKAKRVFKVLDHSGIYLLIAGTYTPVCLVTLAGHGGTVLLAVVWAAAAVGIACEAFWTFRPRWVSAAIYIVMGWAVLFKLPALVQLLGPGGFTLLLAGGIAYTVGCAFYLAKRVKYMHAVWHLFVLAGSTCQFLCILCHVL